MIYRGQVVSLDTPKESMAVRGSALIFPDPTARRFWRDHKINYSVEVKPKASTKESTGTTSKAKHSEEVRIRTLHDLPPELFLIEILIFMLFTKVL